MQHLLGTTEGATGTLAFIKATGIATRKCVMGSEVTWLVLD